MEPHSAFRPNPGRNHSDWRLRLMVKSPLAHQSAAKSSGLLTARPGAPPGQGKVSLLSSEYIRNAKASCFMLLRQAVPRACSFALARAGKRMAAMMAMTPITTSSSIRVNAQTALRFLLLDLLPVVAELRI